MVNLSGMSGAMTLHPMFVHFPIVLILLAAFSELLHVTLKNEFYGRVAGILLNLTALSALVTMYFGYRAADIIGHDSPGHDMVHAHRDIMVWFTWLTVVSAASFQFIKKLRQGYYRMLVLIVLLVIMIFGTDRGAGLVFNYGVGTHSSMDHHEMMQGEEGEGHHHHDEEDEDQHDEHAHGHSDGHEHSH